VAARRAREKGECAVALRGERGAVIVVDVIVVVVFVVSARTGEGA